MKTIYNWFEEYAESHQNKTNKRIHFVCVPLIFLSTIGLLSSEELRFSGENFLFSPATILILLSLIFYFRLSFNIFWGMFISSVLALTVNFYLQNSIALPLWKTSLIIFSIAWVGQFIGHKIEGKKPSFFKDVQFLLIGPAWILSFIYKKLGLKL